MMKKTMIKPGASHPLEPVFWSALTIAHVSSVAVLWLGSAGSPFSSVVFIGYVVLAAVFLAGAPLGLLSTIIGITLLALHEKLLMFVDVTTLTGVLVVMATGAGVQATRTAWPLLRTSATNRNAVREA